jgi:hypothetical protein
VNYFPSSILLILIIAKWNKKFPRHFRVQRKVSSTNPPQLNPASGTSYSRAHLQKMEAYTPLRGLITSINKANDNNEEKPLIFMKAQHVHS